MKVTVSPLGIVTSSGTTTCKGGVIGGAVELVGPKFITVVSLSSWLWASMTAADETAIVMPNTKYRSSARLL